MKRDKQIKLISLALALTIAVVCTVMILGIQINFNQNDTGLKITAPVVTVGLVAILFVYKFIRKQSKTSMVLKHLDSKGKKYSPYLTIAFTYFDYMLWCGIFSCLCGIVSGILESLYQTMVFKTLINWSYGLSRMAIVFAVYVLCLVIYTIGNMLAYKYQKVEKLSGAEDERI